MVESGRMQLHVRTPEGTRIEETERVFGCVEEEMRRLIPPEESQTFSFAGLPKERPYLTLDGRATLGMFGGTILIAQEVI